MLLSYLVLSFKLTEQSGPSQQLKISLESRIPPILIDHFLNCVRTKEQREGQENKLAFFLFFFFVFFLYTGNCKSVLSA